MMFSSAVAGPRQAGDFLRQLRLGWTAAAGLLAWAGPAAAEPPALHAAGRAEGLIADGPYLFWKKGCDREDDSPSQIRWIQAEPAPPQFAGFRQPRTVFETPNCGRYSVRSRNIALDDRYVYWIGEGREPLRLRRDGTQSVPDRFFTLVPRDSGYYLTVADGWLTWGDGSGVFRTGTLRPAYPFDFGQGETLLPRGRFPTIGELLAFGNRHVVQVGRELYILAPRSTRPADGFVSTPFRGGGWVTAFGVTGNRLYAAWREAEGYAITVDSLDASGSIVYRTPPGHAGESVDQILMVGETLYWHIVTRRGGGPLLRLPAGSNQPVWMTGDRPMLLDSRMVSSSGYLFWVEEAGIFRLPLS